MLFAVSLASLMAQQAHHAAHCMVKFQQAFHMMKLDVQEQNRPLIHVHIITPMTVEL